MAKTQGDTALRGSLLAFLGAVCWGFSATCASYLMTTFGISVTWLASVRLIVAGSLFLALSLFKSRDRVVALLRDRKMLALAALYAIVGMILMQLTYMEAVRYAGAGTALLLQETGTVAVMIVSCVQYRRLPMRNELLAIVLALLGVSVIATQGNIGSLGISPLGLLWGLLAGACLAAYNIVPVKLLDKYGSTVTNSLSMPMAALLFLPIGQPWHLPVMSFDGWLALLAVCIIGTFVAYLVYLHGVRQAGPVRASIIGMFEPVSGMVFSCVWLHDAVSVFDVIGCALIFAMVVLIARASD